MYNVKQSLLHTIPHFCKKAIGYLLPILTLCIPTTTAGTNIVFYLILACFLGSGEWQEKWQLVKTHRFIQCTLLLLAYIYLSTLYADTTWQTALSQASKYNKLLLIPIVITMDVSERQLNHCLIGFFTAVMATLVLGILKFYFHLPVTMSEVAVPLPASVFIFHISTNFIMAIATYLLIYLSLSANIQLKYKIALGLWALANFYYVIFMNIARSGYLVLIISLLVLTIVYVKQIQWKKGALILLILIIGFTLAKFFSPNFEQRFNAIQSNVSAYQVGNDTTSLSGRLSFYQNTLAIIKKNPLFGTGIGSFEAVYTQFGHEHHIQAYTSNPHNQFLDITEQLGLIGLLSYLSFLYYAFRYISRRQPLKYVLGMGIFFGFLVGSFVNSWLMDLNPGFFFCLLISLASTPKLEQERNG